MTKRELPHSAVGAAVSAVTTVLLVQTPEPRDLILALFLVGVFFAFAEIWCDDANH